jgi:hypothetical protein
MEGLRWTAWLLIGSAIVPGLVLSMLFFRAHSRDKAPTGQRARGPHS